MTIEVLKKCMPNASAKAMDIYGQPLIDAMIKFEINTPERQAAFIAQVVHESMSLRYMEEIASGDAYDTRTDLGNTPEVDGDGRRYKGRGPIQCTGRDMYAKVSKALNYDFVKYPEHMERPTAACMSSAWIYAVEKSLNVIADKPDLWRGDRGKFKGLDKFEYISVAINGGKTHLNERKLAYKICRKALGIG